MTLGVDWPDRAEGAGLQPELRDPGLLRALLAAPGLASAIASGPRRPRLWQHV